MKLGTKFTPLCCSTFQTPFEELSKYQSQAFSKSGVQDELVISFDNVGISGTGSSASRIVSDRVRAASAVYAAHLDKVDRGGPSISDGKFSTKIENKMSEHFLHWSSAFTAVNWTSMIRNLSSGLKWSYCSSKCGSNLAIVDNGLNRHFWW